MPNYAAPAGREAFHSEPNRLLEGLKYFGLIAMLLDHVNLIWFDRGLPYLTEIGRLAYPIFSTLVLVRLLAVPERSSRYLWKLLIWLPVTELVMYYTLGGNLSIFTTLFLLVSTVMLIDFQVKSWYAGLLKLVVSVLWLSGLMLATEFYSFGFFGVVIPAFTYWVLRNVSGVIKGTDVWPPLIIGIVLLDGFLLQDGLGASTDAFPFFLAVSGVILHFNKEFARIPSHAFYAFYPAHLGVLSLLQWG